eukprot:GHVH01007703.1.p1 GENE.GHVH01007703.1~~GHVH01007703.1.p1  ORF type:complete len:478 (+),score=58.11 GHVH01007703.1:132-1565(+)
MKELKSPQKESESNQDSERGSGEEVDINCNGVHNKVSTTTSKPDSTAAYNDKKREKSLTDDRSGVDHSFNDRSPYVKRVRSSLPFRRGGPYLHQNEEVDLLSISDSEDSLSLLLYSGCSESLNGKLKINIVNLPSGVAVPLPLRKNSASPVSVVDSSTPTEGVGSTAENKLSSERSSSPPKAEPPEPVASMTPHIAWDWNHITCDMLNWERKVAGRELHTVVIDVDNKRKNLNDVTNELRIFAKACRTAKIRPKKNTTVGYIIIKRVTDDDDGSPCSCSHNSLIDEEPADIESLVMLYQKAQREFKRKSRWKVPDKFKTLCSLAMVIHELSVLPRCYLRSSEVNYEGLRAVLFIGFEPTVMFETLLRMVKAFSNPVGTKTRVSFLCPNTAAPCKCVTTYSETRGSFVRNMHASIGGFDQVADDLDCMICMVNHWDSVLLPCGHGQICQSCGDELITKFGMCPICRVEVIEIVKVERD